MLNQAISVIVLASALTVDGAAASRAAAADREITRFQLALASHYGGGITASSDSRSDRDRDQWRYRRWRYR